MSRSRSITTAQVLERRPPRPLRADVLDDDSVTEEALVGLLAALSVPGAIDAGLAAVVSEQARRFRALLGEARVVRGSAFDGRVSVVEGVPIAPLAGRPDCG
ncbi:MULTISPECIES: hypothetical protein [unclassified Rathayibacter]|uniref:hypothetical protein n=1 Tax=unclassified Rathayibacter TaxID=2609250 RepID=UPI0006FA77C8|nr:MULTISPECIES: hypothetical protein [unclassified Rathayibacter]KQQ03664.1 hypothetical protein ASF42_09225 [Rathayibacter sp. Leaf294]KQS12120.1 hypothetical protein ASG06_09225 [Rathayibacter sp. Leaf185]